VNDFVLGSPSYCDFSCTTRTVLCVLSLESESYVTIDGQPASLSWNKAPFWGLRPDLYYCLIVTGLLIWAPSLTRRRVCRLQFLLVLASAVVFGSESRRIRAIFYCLRFETSLFVASDDSQDHGGGIRPRLHTGICAFSLVLPL
jgi:hypothetical protein